MGMKTNKKKTVLYVCLIFFCSIASSLITFLILKKGNNTNYYKENILKVVEVASYEEVESKSYGSGWFLDETTIVTNYHVISYLISGNRESFSNIEIRFYNNDKYEKVTLLKFNEEKDVAFLNYSGHYNHSFFSGHDNNIYNSQKCFCIGNFSNYGLSYKEGYISLDAIKLLYNDNYAIFIQCSISIGQGDSGAPVFNENNEVIGMITFRTKGSTGTVEQCFAYAIPIDRILAES